MLQSQYLKMKTYINISNPANKNPPEPLVIGAGVSFMQKHPVPEGRKVSSCSQGSVGVPTGVVLPYNTSSLPDENCERIWQLHTFNNSHLPHRGKTPCITA